MKESKRLFSHATCLHVCVHAPFIADGLFPLYWGDGEHSVAEVDCSRWRGVALSKLFFCRSHIEFAFVFSSPSYFSIPVLPLVTPEELSKASTSYYQTHN